MEIRNVLIGDKFIRKMAIGKPVLCQVVFFTETRNITTNEHMSYACWATSETFGMGKPFEVPFTTVQRGRI